MTLAYCNSYARVVQAFDIANGWMRVQNMDGGGYVDLPYRGCDPSWSPDGTEIIFVSLDRHWLWIYNINSGVLEPQNVYGDNIGRPTLATNGKIAIQASQAGTPDPAVYTFDRGGTNIVKLVTNAANPCIALDGSWLVFDGATNQFGGVFTSQIFSCNIDGSRFGLFTSPGADWWSPDAQCPSIRDDSIYVAFQTGTLRGAHMGDPNTWPGHFFNIAWGGVGDLPSQPPQPRFATFRQEEPCIPPVGSPNTAVSNPSWWPSGDGVTYDFVATWGHGSWGITLGGGPNEQTWPDPTANMPSTFFSAGARRVKRKAGAPGW